MEKFNRPQLFHSWLLRRITLFYQLTPVSPVALVPIKVALVTLPQVAVADITDLVVSTMVFRTQGTVVIQIRTVEEPVDLDLAAATPMAMGQNRMVGVLVRITSVEASLVDRS